jgi:hypothetical protein
MCDRGNLQKKKKNPKEQCCVVIHREINSLTHSLSFKNENENKIK